MNCTGRQLELGAWGIPVSHSLGTKTLRARAGLLFGPPSFILFVTDTLGWENPFRPKLYRE